MFAGKSLRWLVLLGCWLMVGMLAGCKPEVPPARAPQTGALISPLQTPSTTTPVPAPALPLPTVVITNWAPGTPIAPQEGKMLVFPTMTPWPTFTPRPTPTRVPGPTGTPVPLLQPAKDAAGSIIYFVKDRTNTVSLYSQLMDAKGAPQNSPSLKFATNSPNMGASAGLVYPAPDGSRLAVVGDWGGRSILYVNDGKMKPLFGNNLDPLGLFFNWGPDSRHVLIRAEQNYPDIGLWLVNTDTGEHVTLHDEGPAAIVDGAAASPDGQKVVYAFQREVFSSGEMWLVNADGTNAHLFFTSPNVGAMYDLAWSPDGSKIAFIGDGLMVINADGSNARTICHCSVLNNYLFPPVWSPDSRRLAFVANNTNASESAIMSGDLSAAAIYLVDVDAGKERTLLLNETAGNFDPTWSPDGAQIAFVSTRSGNSEIWVVNVDGTNLRQLTDAGQFVRFPYWRRTLGSVQP